MIKMNRKKFHIVTICVCVVLAVTFVILTAVSSVSSTALLSQRTAEFWKGESDREYSQISVYFSSDAGFNQNKVRDLRTSIEKTFSKIPSDYFGETGTTTAKSDMWTDAYSMETSFSIDGEKSTINVNAVITGGDFFYFRQFSFISGCGYTDGAVTFNSIVLDLNAAWQLFGSTNVAGLTVWVNGYPFIVSGVVDKSSSETSDIYGKSTRVYIPYDAYEMYLGKGDTDLHVTSYEAVLPNPIKDFAYDSVKGSLSSVNEDSMKIVVNSERYDISPLWSTFKALAKRSVRTKEIIFPFWENIASVKADNLSVMMVIRLASAIIVVVTAIVYLMWGLVKLAGKFKRKKYKYL